MTYTSKIDFLLYIGVDSGNEKAYNFLKSRRSDVFFNRDHVKYICTLGKKPSNANYYIDDIDEVKFLINKLRHSTQKRKKTRSYSDLKDLSPLNKVPLRVDHSSANVPILLFLI